MQEATSESRELEPEKPSGHDRIASTRDERLAFWTFAGYLAAALPLLLWMGSYRWFFGDEWSFFADRSVSLHDLFRPYNEQHWVTLPVLAYRGMYSIFGLHAYWPYQLLVILLHLTTAALLRIIMRRAGVGPWIATIAAAAFVLLGAAEDNILWAFQIGFVGAVVAGLTQVVLADHDGPIDRRDWIGLGVGLLGLMMSGQAPPLIAATGLVCVIRRRWTAALLHTVPLGLIFIAWVRLEDVSTVLQAEDHPFTVLDYLRWMNSAAAGLFMALGYFAPIAVLLVLVIVGGTALAWRAEGSAAFLRRAAVPTALVVACVLSMSAAAPSRFYSGPETARAGRYIGIMVALTLPLLAVAADAIIRRWPRSLPLVLVLFIVPAPFNVAAFGDDPVLRTSYYEYLRAFTARLPEHPLATRAPPWVRPNDMILGQPDMTLGWMLQARREGAIPPAGQLTANAEGSIPIRLGVAVTEDDPPQDLTCESYDSPLALDPQVGDQWVFESPVRVAGRSGDRASTLPIGFEPSVVEITLPNLQLLVSPSADSDGFELCR